MIRNYFAPVTLAFVLLCFLGWLISSFFGASVLRVLDIVGVSHDGFWEDTKLWQPVTSMFFPFGMWSFLPFAFLFWSLATPLERALGSIRFAWLVVLTGISAAFAFLLLPIESYIPASGPIPVLLGIMLVLALFYSSSSFRLFFILPVQPWLIAVPVLFAFVFIYMYVRTSGQVLDVIPMLPHLSYLLGGAVVAVLYAKFALGLRFFGEALPVAQLSSRLRRVVPVETSERERVDDLMRQAQTFVDKQRKPEPPGEISQRLPLPSQSNTTATNKAKPGERGATGLASSPSADPATKPDEGTPTLHPNRGEVKRDEDGKSDNAPPSIETHSEDQTSEASDGDEKKLRFDPKTGEFYLK